MHHSDGRASQARSVHLPRVGGTNASQGEMFRALKPNGIGAKTVMEVACVQFTGA